ncbi:MAG: hypothetical protein IKQ66_02475, partial [Treponema sp.]|nr:hypothetical protein [Treponema sp.]
MAFTKRRGASSDAESSELSSAVDESQTENSGAETDSSESADAKTDEAVVKPRRRRVVKKTAPADEPAPVVEQPAQEASAESAPTQSSSPAQTSEPAQDNMQSQDVQT